MYYKFIKDNENQIEKVIETQSDIIIKVLKRPLLPFSKKLESAEVIIEELQEVVCFKIGLHFLSEFLN